MNRCHTDIAQDQYDAKFTTVLSDQKQDVIDHYEDQAFMEILSDEDRIQDVLVDLTTQVIQMISDSSDCYPRKAGSKLEDVISNAHTWQCFVDLIKDKLSDDIDEKADELWNDR